MFHIQQFCYSTTTSMVSSSSSSSLNTVERERNREREREMENGGGCLSSFIDNGSIESHRYYLARKTTMEMLRDRGYDVPYSDIDLSLEEFRSIYGQTPDLDQIRITAPLLSNPSKKILVVFCGTDAIKLAAVRSLYAEIVGNVGLNRVILILQSKLTPQARSQLGLWKVKVEDFQITDLLVNITKHVLKPKHEILTLEEKQKLLTKFSLEDKQLPRMLETDAVARYYGLEKGQVLKVTYAGDITGSHVTYRCIM